MSLIPDNPLDFIERLAKANKWLADNVPLWVIVVAGLLVAVMVPVIVRLVR